MNPAARSAACWPFGVRELRGSRQGVTLIELLCVIAIIGILVSLLALPLGKALRKARGVVGVVETGSQIEEIRSQYSRYRLANPTHGRLRLPEFVHECGLSARAESWLRMSSVSFHPFAGDTPADFVVIETTLSHVSGATRWRVLDLLEPPSRP